MCLEWECDNPSRRVVVKGAAMAGVAAFMAPTVAPALAGRKGVEARAVEIPRGSTATPAMLFRPKSKKRLPLVLVAHGDPGFPAYLQEFCTRLSENGYAALAVDWTHSLPARPEAEAERAAWLNQVGAYRYWKGDDLAAGREWAVREGIADPGRVAAVGFCGGGAVAALYAAQGAPLRALVLFHAAPRYNGRLHSSTDPRPDLVDVTDKLKRVPIQGHFGLHDQAALPADARDFEQRLKAAGAKAEFYYYADAGHGFLQAHTPMNPEGTFGYAPKAARDAEARAFAFLAKHLK